MDRIRRVTVIGMGTLGTQIAIQAAAYGYEVSGFARNPGAFRDIDRARMVFTGMTYGPFFLMDLVGLDVVLAIEDSYYQDSGDPRDKPPAAIAEKVARGELGVKTGKGFYTYPNPGCSAPDFLMAR